MFDGQIEFEELPKLKHKLIYLVEWHLLLLENSFATHLYSTKSSPETETFVAQSTFALVNHISLGVGTQSTTQVFIGFSSGAPATLNKKYILRP